MRGGGWQMNPGRSARPDLAHRRAGLRDPNDLEPLSERAAKIHAAWPTRKSHRERVARPPQSSAPQAERPRGEKTLRAAELDEAAHFEEHQAVLARVAQHGCILAPQRRR